MNMSEIGMKISADYYDFMRFAFINQTCNKRLETGVFYRMCSCRGNNFYGMPEMKFNTILGTQYVLQAKDYLLYPSIEQNTRYTRCGLGILRVKNFNFEYNITQADDKQLPYLQPPPVVLEDYVLGQQFFTIYNPIFEITIDSTNLGWAQNISRNTLGPTMKLIILDKERHPRDNLFLYGMIVTGLLLIWFAASLSVKRRYRIETQKQRWKVIKELEEDYDVYVSDEYAYHIADNKMQMQQL